MKKVWLVLVLLILVSVVTPVYAAEVDGVWVCGTDNTVLFGMSRANGGNILFTLLDYWEEKMAAWIPLFGPFDGTTGQLSLILTSEANGNIPKSISGTLRLFSPDIATLTLNSCTNFPGQDNCGAPGTILYCSKIF